MKLRDEENLSRQQRAIIDLAVKSKLLIGFLAIIGSFMVSYTADKYDGLMQDRILQGKGFRLGRDVRILLMLLGALLNQVTLTLVVIAIVMNVETIRRLVICRDHG